LLGEGNGTYTDKSAYNKIRNEMRRDDDIHFQKLWTTKDTTFYTILSLESFLEQITNN